MPNIKTLFDWVKCINQTKDPISSFTEEDWDKFDNYMIHRALSQDKDLIELVDYVQSLAIQDKKQVYTIYCEFIPKNKKWNGWIKSKTKGKNKELITLMNKYFECSSKRSIENLELLSKESTTNILKSFGIEDKEIKKLLK